jgi:hypothetical protein
MTHNKHPFLFKCASAALMAIFISLVFTIDTFAQSATKPALKAAASPTFSTTETPILKQQVEALQKKVNAGVATESDKKTLTEIQEVLQTRIPQVSGQSRTPMHEELIMPDAAPTATPTSATIQPKN